MHVSCASHFLQLRPLLDDADHFNWCVVPDKSYDAVLFGAMAVLVAVLLQGKYSALWTLIAGGALQALALPFKTGPLGNGIAIWLGIQPADLFLYIFLPPMLVDAAVRIDYFIFRKMLYHVLVFAFLIVIASTALMTPILLYVFNLRSVGWLWQHAALFSAMIAPTDAVSVSSILKKGGGLDKIVVLMEGESLFNDATSIVLFEIFFEMVKKLGDGGPGTEGGLLQEGLNIVVQISWLAAGGFAIGFALGFITKWLLTLLRSRGAKAPEEMALTLAMAYLAFYLANAPAQVSGVIAVVVYGLYGSATAKWGLSPKVAESGVFDNFWDTIGFAITGLVFFFSGVSCVNFFYRSAQELYNVEHFAFKTVAVTFWRLPVIFIVIFLVRGLLIVMFNPLFKLSDSHLPAPVILFATFGGLRGAVSLILAQMLVSQQDQQQKSRDMLQTAQISMWTAGIVVLTLLVNAPLIPMLLKWTGLSQVSPVKAKMRAKAARAFSRYTENAVDELKNDEDEMLRGVDWKAVRDFVDASDSLHEFAHPEGIAQPHDGPQKRHPTRFQKVLIRVKKLWLKLTGQQQAERERAHQRDELAEPLLHEEEEERERDRLEDIQEVDLEAGQGSPPHASSSTDRQEDSATERQDPLGSDSEEEEEAPVTPRVYGAGSASSQPSTIHTGTVVSKGDMQKVLNQHQNNQFAQDVPFMGGDTDKESGGNSGVFDPGNVHSQDTEAPQSSQNMTDQPQRSASRQFSLRAHLSFPNASQRSSAPPVSAQQQPPRAAAVAGAKAANDKASEASDDRQPKEDKGKQGQAGGAVAESQGGSQGGVSLLRVAQSPFSAWRGEGPAESSDQKDKTEDAASSSTPDGGQQGQLGGSQDGPDGSARASMESITLQHVTRQDEEGEKYNVVPQPIVAPEMVHPGEVGGGERLPNMCWMNVDLHRLAQQKESATVSLPGQPGERSLRRMKTSKPGKRQGNKSASGRDLTGHNKLDRSISGPLSMTGGAPPSSKKQEPQELAGAAIEPEDEEGLSAAEVLSEERIRLVSGLKRYFHEKRGRGLISAEGVQLLDHACSAAVDQSSQRLNIWTNIEKDLCGGWGVAFLANFLFQLRRYNVSRHDWRSGGLPIWIVVQWPTFKLGEILGSVLSKTMLLSIEVAVEYWLSLTWSPQAQWLCDSTHDSPLRDEIQAESKKVWKFIIDREIEAPARFQAIQSYRAAMAILRQQTNFVEQLYSSGMLDEQEQEQLLELVEKKERRLHRKGAVWRAPKIVEILKQLPFLQNTSADIFRRLLQRGELVKYQKGQVMWQPPSDEDKGGDGIYVVMAGLVKSSYRTPDGELQEFFLGSGGVFGLLQALVGEVLPGSARCVAVGNALLQGPVVFHFPQYLLGRIKQRAMEGDLAVLQLLVDLYRVAALYTVDRLKSEVITSAITHYQHIAVLQARHHIIKRILNRQKVKHPDRHKTARVLWGQNKRSAAFQAIVAQEFDRALTTLSSEVMQNEAEREKKTLSDAVQRPAAAKCDDSQPGGSGPEPAYRGTPAPTPPQAAVWNPFKSKARVPQTPEAEQSEEEVVGDGRQGQGAVKQGRPLVAVPSDQEILTSLPPDKIWDKMQQHASEALGELRYGLRDALVLELQAGEAFLQESSVVLLAGKLLVTGRADSVPLHQLAGPEGQEQGPAEQPEGPFQVSLQYNGPAVLLWLWSNARSSENTGLKACPIKHTAGSSGAVVMVCPPVPALLSLHQPGQDGSDDDHSDSDSDRPVNLDEAVDTRGAWGASGEVKDQWQKQRQMMADGNLRGFWKKQGCCRLKRYARLPKQPHCMHTCCLLLHYSLAGMAILCRQCSY
ncbi:Son of sevenless 1, variant 2 [Trebouxia sp. C0009 RCD-2024]